MELVDEVYRLPIPSEVKVAFICYIKATEKTEIQKLRFYVLKYLFNYETAFELAERERTGCCFLVWLYAGSFGSSNQTAERGRTKKDSGSACL